MKRLFVSPDARGLGWGRHLVEATLRHAAAAGFRALRLGTLPQAMPAADALYRAMGFRPIAQYDGAACGATCYEKAL
jgi:GNAT superfamily N-acetyltransferase